MLIEFCPRTIYPVCNSASLLEERGCQMMFSPLAVFLWLRRWFSSPEQAEPAGRQVWEQGAFRDGMAGRQLQRSVWVARETRQPLHSKLFTFLRQDTRLLQTETSLPHFPCCPGSFSGIQKRTPCWESVSCGFDPNSVTLKVSFTAEGFQFSLL